MSTERSTWKVGLFVLTGLVLMAGLMIYFSKGIGVFSRYYEIYLVTQNVGGIKTMASVLMAGVPIGTVSAADLGPLGTNVTLSLRIDPRFLIPSNSLFVIEQSGFLGDQYVSVYPSRTGAQPLKEGAIVRCQEPFNLQEVARSAAGFIHRIDETARKLNDAITRVDRSVLDETTLGHLSSTIRNFREVSDKALATMDGLDRVVQSNIPPVTLAVSNVLAFSEQLGRAAGELEGLLHSNRAEIETIVKNVESTSGILKQFVTDLNNGQGLLGAMLRQRPAETNMAQTLHHLTLVSSNLSFTTSNLNARGLWGVMFAPKPAKPATTPRRPSRP